MSEKNRISKITESKFVSDLFDFNPLYALVALSILVMATGLSVYTFVAMAPPKDLYFLSGPEGGSFHTKALEYQKFLRAHSIKVHVLPSKGSVDNLNRITEPGSQVDVAFIQSGLIDPDNDPLHDYAHVTSLGSVANQPMFFFYRGREKQTLNDFGQKKIAVGTKSSGTFKLAQDLLKLHNMQSRATLVEVGGTKALSQLKNGTIDAAFIMSEKIGLEEIKDLLLSRELKLLNFKQGSKAYVRKLEYLNIFDLPTGIVDFELNTPSQDLVLIGPTVELIATDRLHPAVSDLLLHAAMQIHYRPDLFQKRGVFPSATAHILPLSQDAQRFYQSGRGLLYRHLPFGLASFVSRTLFVILPLLFVVIPGIQALPWFFRWKNQLKIRRLYKELMKLEKEFRIETNKAVLERLQQEFQNIDHEIRLLKVKPAYAEQFYHLRKHIDYVRRLMAVQVN